MAAMATDTVVEHRPGRRPGALELGARRRPGDPVGVRARARSARHRHASSRATGCSSAAATSRPSDGGTFATVNPATEETLALVARGTAADADKAVRAARRAQTRSWGTLPGRERAKYLFRIARILQERSREFAVLESMDTGKPIKESRDVDVPLAAAHFWYYAGWADKLEYAFPGRVARPLGVAAQIIPWNFPLLMLAWKIAPALAAGNTVVLKPASTTPLSRTAVRRRLPPGRPAARRRQHRHRARRDRDGARHPSRRRQGRLHRLDRDRQADRQGRGRDRQGADARARRQGGQHRVRRRPARPGRRGHRQRHLLQPGRGLLRRLAPARPGVDRRAAHRQAQGPAGDDPRRRPARQEHRRRGDQLEGPAREDHRARRVRGGRGRRALPARLRPARARLLLPPDPVHQRRPEPPHRPRGDLRPGAVRADLPDPGRGGREGQQHALRAVGRDLDGQGFSGSSRWSRRCGPASSGRTRSTGSTRPRRSAATRSPGFGREGGMHGLHAYVRLEDR